MPDAPQPLVLIVSGPSGSGKSTLVQKILELHGTMFSISCTTRPPRPTENPGKWYDFVSEAEFERMAKRGEFLEYARVFGKHWYGTPRKWLEQARQKGLDLVLEIDVQGAQQLRALHMEQKLSELVSIFIVPPSRQELERRIRARGQDSEQEIARRLERARQEMQHYRDYDYIVVNDDVERAGRAVQAIVAGARCRRGRNEQLVRNILDSFGG